MSCLFHVYARNNCIGLTTPRFIEVPVRSKDNERSCVCVLGISILPLSSILILEFRTVPPVWYFLFFILLYMYKGPFDFYKSPEKNS